MDVERKIANQLAAKGRHLADRFDDAVRFVSFNPIISPNVPDQLEGRCGPRLTINISYVIDASVVHYCISGGAQFPWKLLQLIWAA